jgi:GAF domain-containing protein/HAMP domain-containing protein
MGSRGQRMSTPIFNSNRGSGLGVATPGQTLRRRWISVRLRFLILVVGTGLIVLGLGSYAIFNIAQNVALDEVRLRTTEIANNTALQLNDRLARLSESANAAAAATVANTGDLATLHTTLSQIGLRESDFLNIYVLFDRQVIPSTDYAVVWETRDTLRSNEVSEPTKPFYPNLLGSTNFTSSLPAYDYFKDDPRFNTAKNANPNKVVWTESFIDVGGPVRTNNVAGVTPIYDVKGKFIGVAGVDLQFGQIGNYIGAVRPTPQSFALLIDQNGKVLAYPGPVQLDIVDKTIGQFAEQYTSVAFQQLGEQMIAGKSGVSELLDPLTGLDTFIAYHPIEATGWSVAVLIPRADVVGSIDQMGHAILGFTLAALIAFAFIGLLLSEIVVRPLIRLTRTATTISAGNLKQIAVIERNDEIGVLASTLNTITGHLSDLIDSLETRVEVRTAQLQAGADVGQAATSVLNPDQLLKTVVNLITDRFGFYYAAAFIVDDSGKWAVLDEATGDSGRKLKELGHKLEVGGQSMVGTCIAEHKPKIALDVGAEAVRFVNPLLPDTRSEIALPLIVGNRVLGALDVQSAQAAAFDEANTNVLQSMADQIAVALNNAAQYSHEQVRAKQTAALLSALPELTVRTSQAALFEQIIQLAMRLLNADGAGLWRPVEDHQIELKAAYPSSGSMLLTGRRLPVGEGLAGRVFATRQTVRIDDYAAWSSDSNVFDDAPFQSMISVPMIWQEQVIGVLSITHSQPGKPFSDDDETTLKLLATQSAAALVNIDLVEQQQRTLNDLDAINRRLTGEAWQTHLKNQAIVYETKRGGASLIEPVTATDFPIMLRGQAIGAIMIENDQSARTLTDDDRSIIERVIQQMSLALENQRLTEVALRAAQRDRTIAEAADRIHQPTDLDAVLQVAVEEISRIVGTRDVRIQLGGDPLAGDGNGHLLNDGRQA